MIYSLRCFCFYVVRLVVIYFQLPQSLSYIVIKPVPYDPAKILYAFFKTLYGFIVTILSLTILYVACLLDYFPLKVSFALAPHSTCAFLFQWFSILHLKCTVFPWHWILLPSFLRYSHGLFVYFCITTMML